jgi:hypothetical protein
VTPPLAQALKRWQKTVPVDETVEGGKNAITEAQ